MDDEIESLLIDVRANTQGFQSDIEAMRGSFDTTLLGGFEQAGNVLERGLLGDPPREPGLRRSQARGVQRTGPDRRAGAAIRDRFAVRRKPSERAWRGVRQPHRRLVRPSWPGDGRAGFARQRLSGRRARSRAVRADQRGADRNAAGASWRCTRGSTGSRQAARRARGNPARKPARRRCAGRAAPLGKASGKLGAPGA